HFRTGTPESGERILERSSILTVQIALEIVQSMRVAALARRVEIHQPGFGLHDSGRIVCVVIGQMSQMRYWQLLAQPLHNVIRNQEGLVRGCVLFLSRLAAPAST